MSDSVGALVREGFLLLTSTGGPILAVLLVAGLVVGLVQAATQINDPALGFLPRLGVLIAGAWVMGGWVLERFATFFSGALERMAQR
jgi:flagellar biosynthesis protein FliQ